MAIFVPTPPWWMASSLKFPANLSPDSQLCWVLSQSDFSLGLQTPLVATHPTPPPTLLPPLTHPTHCPAAGRRGVLTVASSGITPACQAAFCNKLTGADISGPGLTDSLGSYACVDDNYISQNALELEEGSDLFTRHWGWCSRNSVETHGDLCVSVCVCV